MEDDKRVPVFLPATSRRNCARRVNDEGLAAMSSRARKPKVKWTEQMNKDVLECKNKAQELVLQRILLATRMEGKEDILTL